MSLFVTVGKFFIRFVPFSEQGGLRMLITRAFWGKPGFEYSREEPCGVNKPRKGEVTLVPVIGPCRADEDNAGVIKPFAPGFFLVNGFALLSIHTAASSKSANRTSG